MSLFAVFYMIFAYLLGSVSSAILICKMAGLPDPRQNGSHNPGSHRIRRHRPNRLGSCRFYFRYLARSIFGKRLFFLKRRRHRITCTVLCVVV